jgi:hypothetical protein
MFWSYRTIFLSHESWPGLSTLVAGISATAFEVRASDFAPTRDLNIIILGRK